MSRRRGELIGPDRRSYFAFLAAAGAALEAAGAALGAAVSVFFVAEAPSVSFLMRHSLSCFVRRAFCLRRRGESCGVVMVARVLAKPGAQVHVSREAGCH